MHVECLNLVRFGLIPIMKNQAEYFTYAPVILQLGKLRSKNPGVMKKKQFLITIPLVVILLSLVYSQF